MNKVLEYANVLYENGRYAESKDVLSEIYKIYYDNKKNLSKVILALWKLFAINILLNDTQGALATFSQIQSHIALLKTSLEEEFRQHNIESVIF